MKSFEIGKKVKYNKIIGSYIGFFDEKNCPGIAMVSTSSPRRIYYVPIGKLEAC